jgi:hypothetical protein
MAKENEGQSLRDYGNRKKRIQRRRKFFVTTLLLAVAVIAVIYLFRLYNRSYKDYEVVSRAVITSENAAAYLSYGSAIVKYNKDGAMAIDKDGSLLWNGSYEMLNPIADTKGKYVVIADKGKKLIHIYNNKGSVGSFSTLYSIIKVEIAEQGVVAALMEDEESTYIILYDVDGTELAQKKTSVNKVGYPIDFALSEDGEKVVTSFMSVNTGELVSTVAFYNFGEVGQNFTDRFTGGWEYKDILIPRVAFLGNNKAVIYKENGFSIFKMKEIPSLEKEITLEVKIQSVFYNDKFVGAITEPEGGTAKQLLLYDLDGKIQLDQKLDFDYNNVYLSNDEIIMRDNLNCIIMKYNGKVKFRHTFDSNIAAFYPVNNLDRYIMVDSSDITQILLKE